MRTAGIKITALFLFLSIMLKVFLPFNISINSISFLRNVVPGIFGVIVATCAPVDAIGNAVNKLLTDNNALTGTSPLENSNKDKKEKKAEGNTLFLPSQLLLSKYSNEIKKSSVANHFYMKRIVFDAYNSCPFDAKPGSKNILLLFMILLAYISILYRDVWAYKLKNNIY